MSLGKKIGMELLILGACLTLGASVPARVAHQDTQQPAADNSKTNKRDQNSATPTADQQYLNLADRNLTKKIRASLNGDKSLSTYAQNIKIISQDGKVTLTWPGALRRREGGYRSQGHRTGGRRQGDQLAGARAAEVLTIRCFPNSLGNPQFD
jgi:hyperosmotically inducible periplasmic protein